MNCVEIVVICSNMQSLATKFLTTKIPSPILTAAVQVYVQQHYPETILKKLGFVIWISILLEAVSVHQFRPILVTPYKTGFFE